MTILVTGSTGRVGTDVVRELVRRGAAVRALRRSTSNAPPPAGAALMEGDMLKPADIRKAVEGVSTLFLLAAVAPDELDQAMFTLTLALEAGVSNVVYLSAIHADRFTDVPHFASKATVERAIADLGVAATVLRAGYFIQNEASLKDMLMGQGLYPMALGDAGTLFVDTRDLAEVAAVELVRREDGGSPLPAETLDVVAPEVLTGPDVARLWADALGREVRYGGDDLDVQEQGFLRVMPDWMAYDMRLMMKRFQREPMQVDPTNDARLQSMLGRPMRTYGDFIREIAASWTAGS